MMNENLVKEREEDRQEIEQAVQAFLQSGKQIDVIEQGKSGTGLLKYGRSEKE